MDNRTIDKLNVCNNLSDLMILLKTELEKSINTSTLAFFDKVIQPFDAEKGYQIISVKPFPLINDEEEYTLLAYCFNDSQFNINEKLVILFMDKNFINNLSFNIPKLTKTNKIHSTQYAVGIKLFNEEIKYYRHNICLDLQSKQIYIKIINKSATPITNVIDIVNLIKERDVVVDETYDLEIITYITEPNSITLKKVSTGLIEVYTINKIVSDNIDIL